MALLIKSAIPVWIVSILCAVAIALLADPSDYLTLLPVVLGFTVILTLCVQLAVRQAAGYILRLATTLAGSLVLLGLVTAALAPAALLAG